MPSKAMDPPFQRSERASKLPRQQLFQRESRLIDNSLTISSIILFEQLCMSEGPFVCVNCQLQFPSDCLYKTHYKSEHHRYNVKRKLIGLPPLSLPDYSLQFQSEVSSKSQSHSEIYCEVCSKKFMSAQTYKQHINSNKHKTNRKALLKNKSESSSLSEFELIDQKLADAQTCPFCPAQLTEAHLAQHHSFPPFRHECVDLQGLINKVLQEVKAGNCLFCLAHFACEQSAKQHMTDLGHSKLDLQNFAPYELYYLWKISESSEEEEAPEILEMSKEESEFSVLSQQTLQSLEEKRLARIKYGVSGATINGKEVGYRAYRHYYKQYLERQIQAAPREQQKALTQDNWQDAKAIVARPQFQRVQTRNTHR